MRHFSNGLGDEQEGTEATPLWICHNLKAARDVQFIFFYNVLLFRAAPAAYGDSQARGPIRATAAAYATATGSKLCLRPTPQLMATLDP